MSAPNVCRTFGLAAVLSLVAAAPAVAAPAWRIDALSNTTAQPGATFEEYVIVTNVGDTATDGSPLRLTATLPAGLTAVASRSAGSVGFECAGPGGRPLEEEPAADVTCVAGGELPAHTLDTAHVIFTVRVDPSVSGLRTGSFGVSGGGGGVVPASTLDPITITPALPPFGVDAFDGQVASDVAGDASTQAGGHPYSASTSIDFNTVTNANPLLGMLWPVEPTKDIRVELPPGFVVDPTVTAQCTAAQLANSHSVEAEALCPPDSQVGVVSLAFDNLFGRDVSNAVPVFNLVPPSGVPARLGFNVSGTVVTIDGGVRGAGDYGLTADLSNVSEGLDVARTTLTLWGDPFDSSHAAEHACPGVIAPWEGGPSCPSGLPPAAFLRNPTACTPPGVGLPTTLSIDSWAHPGVFRESSFVSHLPPAYPAAPSEWGAVQGPTGCASVPFDPVAAMAPATPARAGQPDGFSFDLKLPQSTDPNGIGEGDLKKAVVTLPQGVRLSPGGAAGLGACSPAQIGLHTETEPACPDASKLGTVNVVTPLLKEPLTGSLYLATPHENPFGSLVALYLVAKGPGVTIKLPGRVDLDPSTGQITTTFDENPQLPFSDLTLKFDGGSRAALALPSQCGTYTTHAVLTSWSGKTVVSDSSFSVVEGPDGGPCSGLGFAPSFSGGTSSTVAGAFAPFSFSFSRSDGEQELKTLTDTFPPGLLADIATVPRCSNADAAAGTCSAASQIGTVLVGSGSGPNPFFLPGKVFLTGPYEGAPFGEAVVVRAVAGPFDLGTVVVRGAIGLDTSTGQVTVSSDPFPRILQGIPVDTRRVDVTLDRPNFSFNPTNCAPLAITGTLFSTEGASAPIAERFQAGDCASLKFKPSFKVTTAANGTFNRGGASLDVKITAAGEGPGKGEANIATVETQLPKMLPSRLTTLQKACTEKQFASNPAGCPPESAVGTARAITPILASPLEGPAYLVSHGGAAFPDLVLVLQGEGIVLHVVGHTQIKNGITYSRFQSVPDAPISSFELRLPEGRYSVLAAVGKLCGSKKLGMPTKITAQNGMVEELKPSVQVLGCTHGRKRSKR